MQLFSSLSAEEILTLAVYGEARGESIKGKIAVMNVIRNRTENIRRYGNIDYAYRSVYHAVILKKYQFSCFNEGNVNRKLLEKIALDFDRYLKKDLVLHEIFTLVKAKDYIMDIVYGANHYFSRYIEPPSWAKHMKYCCSVDNHLFFKDER
jgi:hypothetical protein